MSPHGDGGCNFHTRLRPEHILTYDMLSVPVTLYRFRNILIGLAFYLLSFWELRTMRVGYKNGTLYPVIILVARLRKFCFRCQFFFGDSDESLQKNLSKALFRATLYFSCTCAALFSSCTKFLRYRFYIRLISFLRILQKIVRIGTFGLLQLSLALVKNRQAKRTSWLIAQLHPCRNCCLLIHWCNERHMFCGILAPINLRWSNL